MARPMSRREFVGIGMGAAAAGAAAYVLGTERPWDTSTASKPRPPLRASQGILVLVGLFGGNDGLNTLIPYQDSAYLAGRATLGYQPTEVLPLSDGLALHPNLTGLKHLWDTKQLAVIRGVGYPDPNRSHFRSMDIWQSAVPETDEITGWIGRWLDTTPKRDPLQAVSLGPTLPRAFSGAKTAGAALPSGRLQAPNTDPLLRGFASLERSYLGEPALAARAAQSGADSLRVQSIFAAALNQAQPSTNGSTSLEGGQTATSQNSGPTPTTKPAAAALANNPLAVQLDTVARAILADVPTRVYGVSLGGFDTHAAEKDTHARLIGYLDTGITSFFATLGTHPRAAHVVVATYSEFGRRVAANASGGTDHGTAAPLFVAGPSVHGGFYGDEPPLTNLDNGDLRFTTDFRAVYATMLARVLDVDPKTALPKPPAQLAFV